MQVDILLGALALSLDCHLKGTDADEVDGLRATPYNARSHRWDHVRVLRQWTARTTVETTVERGYCVSRTVGLSVCH